MPGVPTGRGCEACRKQKKKCDQLRPSCGRCSRLYIECIGSGEQRYTFKNRSLGKIHQLQKSSPCPVALSVSSSEATLTASALITALSITDVRYSPLCYGEFLKELPRRIGTNLALDAAVRLFSQSMPGRCWAPQQACVSGATGRVDTLVRYGQALRMLRKCLDDEGTYASMETLCAMYLIRICQGWILREGDGFLNHGETVAQILNTVCSTKTSPMSQTEALILSTLCGSVLFEAICNPRLKLDPAVEEFFMAHGSAETGSAPKVLGTQFFRRLCRAIREPHTDPLELEALHNALTIYLPGMRENLYTIAATPDGQGDQLPLVQFQTTYSLLLALALTLNLLVQAMATSLDNAGQDNAEQLAIDCALHVEKVVSLGEMAKPHRPLGSSFMPLCLAPAWLATRGTLANARIEELFEDYRNDFVDYEWRYMCLWLQEKIDMLTAPRTITTGQTDRAYEIVDKPPTDIHVFSGVVYALDSKTHEGPDVQTIKAKCVVM